MFIDEKMLRKKGSNSFVYYRTPCTTTAAFPLLCQAPPPHKHRHAKTKGLQESLFIVIEVCVIM